MPVLCSIAASLVGVHWPAPSCSQWFRAGASPNPLKNSTNTNGEISAVTSIALSSA
jgi:hypothetical protein